VGRVAWRVFCWAYTRFANVRLSSPSAPKRYPFPSLDNAEPLLTVAPFTAPRNKGHISLDEQDIAYLDPDWVRSKVMGITQSSCVVLEGKSVAENVSCVVRSTCYPLLYPPPGLRCTHITTITDRTPTREEIEDACRAALLHDFILDLPNGYDTILGGSAPPPGLDVLDDAEAPAPTTTEKKLRTSGEGEAEEEGKAEEKEAAYRGGITLSGGQKQRLSFARARLRNPEVLILGASPFSLSFTVISVYSCMPCDR
jgi:ATP-binding cassette, subfamily B (MDR/TAP), member 1